MPDEPISHPGERVFFGIEMLDQLKGVVAVLARSARVVVELPARVQAEAAAVGAKSIIARAIGNGDSAGSRGDLDHVGVKPGMIGGG
jgi:hypothetical protein